MITLNVRDWSPIYKGVYSFRISKRISANILKTSTEMGNDGRNHEIQRQREQRQQQQQQQQQALYMSPQTENLTHMYTLVERLVKQLQKNRTEKEKVVWNVDVLSKQLGQRADVERDSNDVVLFDRFLKQRTPSSNPDDICFSKEEKVETLRRQNEQLHQILSIKKDLNSETMDVLRTHEDSLEQVVALLRTEVVDYHKEFITRVRRKLNEELIPLEEEEFTSYLDNVHEVQELMHISELYRCILHLD